MADSIDSDYNLVCCKEDYKILIKIVRMSKISNLYKEVSKLVDLTLNYYEKYTSNIEFMIKKV
jgi:hypothetical protein